MSLPSETVPRIPWWVSTPLALLVSGVFAYAFVRSLYEPDPPWDPPWAAAIYRVMYGALAVIFLGGAAVAIRTKPRPDR